MFGSFEMTTQVASVSDQLTQKQQQIAALQSQRATLERTLQALSSGRLSRAALVSVVGAARSCDATVVVLTVQNAHSACRCYRSLLMMPW